MLEVSLPGLLGEGAAASKALPPEAPLAGLPGEGAAAGTALLQEPTEAVAPARWLVGAELLSS